MSRVCDVTGKKPMFVNNVSHAHNKSRRRFNIKGVILFPLIVYAVIVLIDSFISLFMVGSTFGFCMAGKESADRIDTKISLICHNR